jgi:hypothetical protein
MAEVFTLQCSILWQTGSIAIAAHFRQIPMSPRTAQFHEDDYGQIELLPAQNWAHCAQELGRIREISEVPKASQTPDNSDWTELCLRSHAPLSIAALGIDFAGVTHALALHLPQFDTVETDYGPYTEKCPDTCAFGYAKGYIIYVSHNDSGHVSAIWLALGPATAQEKAGFLAALHTLDALGPLLLVDWGWNALLRLRETSELLAYLHAHARSADNAPQT